MHYILLFDWTFEKMMDHSEVAAAKIDQNPIHTQKNIQCIPMVIDGQWTGACFSCLSQHWVSGFKCWYRTVGGLKLQVFLICWDDFRALKPIVDLEQSMISSNNIKEGTINDIIEYHWIMDSPTWRIGAEQSLSCPGQNSCWCHDCCYPGAGVGNGSPTKDVEICVKRYV